LSLKYDVHNVAPKPIPSQIPGFEESVGGATWPPSTSTLIWDEEGGCLLVDCLITSAEAGGLVEWIKTRGQAPERIYITHPHADHMLGLSTIIEAFPEASPIALADSIPAMESQISDAAMTVWSAFFPNQLPTSPIAPNPMTGTTIPIGNAVATVIPVGNTDTEGSTVVHVPDLSLIVAGDVVYNNTHMWLQGSTPETRANWIRALDHVDDLEASTVIAGHRDPSAPDDDARRQIDTCRAYLHEFEPALARSDTPATLIQSMTDAFPKLANAYTLWVAAFDLLGPKA
jgi:glyoxylase-like metal-dependent hydrolase (beta-lactamase superfamily II)